MSNDNRLQNILKQAQMSRPQAPLHLETQVVARWQERSSHAQSLRQWQWLTAGAFVCIVVGLVLYQAKESESYISAALSRPYVVRMDFTELQEYAQLEAEILLPEGVTFYSKSIPELSEHRSLKMSWNKLQSPEHLPFVIVGKDVGFKTVSVKIFDQNQKLVGEKKLRIRFQESSGARG